VLSLLIYSWRSAPISTPDIWSPPSPPNNDLLPGTMTSSRDLVIDGSFSPSQSSVKTTVSHFRSFPAAAASPLLPTSNLPPNISPYMSNRETSPSSDSYTLQQSVHCFFPSSPFRFQKTQFPISIPMSYPGELGALSASPGLLLPWVWTPTPPNVWLNPDPPTKFIRSYPSPFLLRLGIATFFWLCARRLCLLLRFRIFPLPNPGLINDFEARRPPLGPAHSSFSFPSHSSLQRFFTGSSRFQGVSKAELVLPPKCQV